MSTRATYQINGTTFYIHYDGYPTGAAEYFYNMMTCDNTRGGLACRFIRGNELAEITKSHSYHGDTEYRYDMDEDGLLMAFMRIDFTDKWEKIFEGHWNEFITQYSDHKVHKIAGGYYSVSHAVDMALAKAREYAKWISKGMVGNAGHRDIEAMQIAYDLDDEDLMRHIEEICAKGRREALG